MVLFAENVVRSVPIDGRIEVEVSIRIVEMSLG